MGEHNLIGGKRPRPLGKTMKKALKILILTLVLCTVFAVMASAALTEKQQNALIKYAEQFVTEGKRRITYFIPNSDGGALNTLYRVATVESVDYGADGMTVLALADAKARGMLRKYALDDPIEKEDWE